MNPKVSIIISTKNSAEMIAGCLASIKAQTYENIEIIVVDHPLTVDHTFQIAQRYTDKVFKHGEERCSQRNYGASIARGKYLLIIDSDMELSPGVVAACVSQMGADRELAGVVIPEESFGQGFWAQCKKLERSFYLGVDWIEAARFFRREDFITIGGYNEQLIMGEDWDLAQRLSGLGKTGRIIEFIYHNEGRIDLIKTLKKKLYYAGIFKKYAFHTQSSADFSRQSSVWQRYGLFFSQPGKLMANPALGIGMLFMKTCELGAGAVAIIISDPWLGFRLLVNRSRELLVNSVNYIYYLAIGWLF